MKKIVLIFLFLCISFYVHAQTNEQDFNKILGKWLRPDGGYILAGYTESFGAGEEDFWLVKTDANGDSLWSRYFGGANLDICEAVEQTQDGGYILAGVTNSYSGWLVKTDSFGNWEWDQIPGYGWLYDLVLTDDGGFAAAGATLGMANDFWLLKADQNGSIEWQKTYGFSLRFVRD